MSKIEIIFVKIYLLQAYFIISQHSWHLFYGNFQCHWKLIEYWLLQHGFHIQKSKWKTMDDFSKEKVSQSSQSLFCVMWDISHFKINLPNNISIPSMCLYFSYSRHAKTHWLQDIYFSPKRLGSIHKENYIVTMIITITIFQTSTLLLAFCQEIYLYNFTECNP